MTRWSVALLSLNALSCGGQTEAPLGSSTTPPVEGHPSITGVPSCRLDRPGANAQCGASGNLDCCEPLAVPGGTFLRDNDPGAPATLSAFKLDRFEVTVGRFRAFVEAYPGSKPGPGDGAHPRIQGSGWRQEWDAYLPATSKELSERLIFIDEAALKPDTPKEDLEWVFSWTPEKGPNENLAIGNLNWPLAFAFCAWDGGRLPTEAEWDYAAEGGQEQRPRPWGSEPVDDTRSAFWGTVLKEKKLRPVGSAPAGASRWGHLDMGGSASEMVFDGVSSSDYYTTPCQDCALLDPYPYPQFDGRRLRDLPPVVPGKRFGAQLSEHNTIYGVRCARD